MDASRSGLGGYRWQLELCLLAAADAEADASGVARLPVVHERPSGGRPLSPGAAATPRSPPGPPRRPRNGRLSGPSEQPPEPPHRRSPPRADVAVRHPDASRPTAPAPAPQGDLADIRAAWPQIVTAIGRNPANRPLVATCRPVEMRDGILVLGFPEDQAFMRDIAERKRLVLEDGIAAVVGRPVAVRCVVTNLELVEAVDPGEGDLVAQARRIFEGELVGVEDVD